MTGYESSLSSVRQRLQAVHLAVSPEREPLEWSAGSPDLGQPPLDERGTPPRPTAQPQPTTLSVLGAQADAERDDLRRRIDTSPGLPEQRLNDTDFVHAQLEMASAAAESARLDRENAARLAEAQAAAMTALRRGAAFMLNGKLAAARSEICRLRHMVSELATYREKVNYYSEAEAQKQAEVRRAQRLMDIKSTHRF